MDLDIGTLARALGPSLGVVRDVVVTASTYTTSSPMYDVVARSTGGRVTRLVVKDIAWDSLIPAATDVKPRFLHDPRREPAVYQQLLEGRGFGTPIHYATLDDNGLPRWLVLERVAGRELYQVGSPASWCAAAAWLGRFHAANTRLTTDSPAPLLCHDKKWFQLWAERARCHLGDGAPAWLDRYDAVAEHLSALARTLVHGDFSASNVLICSSERVCPVDWEVAASGPGVLDLAALTLGWERPMVSQLVDAYRETARRPVPDIDVVTARLHLCVQWLGWSSRWLPPASQARDWRREAEDLAMAVGL
jgi:Phosphotransferase enzyme family